MNFRKKYKTLIILSLLVIYVLLYFLNKNNYKDLFKTVNEERLENNTTDTEITQIDLSQYKFDENEKYNLGISQEQLKYLNFRYSLTSSGEIKYNELNINTEIIELTKEDAISDINFLFNALKYSYAGYIYFGGDEIWNTAKNNIINSINSYEDKLTSKDLEKIIFNNLNFVQDGHFSINFNSPLQKSNFYYSEEFEIKEDKQGYYINYSNNKWYIKSINNDSNIENYIKLSLNKEGDLCNYIGFLSKVNYLGKIKVVLKSSNEEQIIYVKLTKNKGNSYLNQSTAYNYEKINGIPIFTMRRMYNIDSNDNSVELFVESASKAKNEKVIIMDIRGNIGGNDFGVIEWFENFIGKTPDEIGTFIFLNSLINNNLIKSAFEENTTTQNTKSVLSENILMQRNRLLEIANSNENRWYIETLKNNENTLIKNNTKVFVLTDNNVASSGETFLRLLKNIENIVFVGTNTSGVGLCDATTECILPNSKINIIYGSNLRLYNNFIEGIGFQPDVWIGENDSLDRLLKFIN